MRSIIIKSDVVIRCFCQHINFNNIIKKKNLDNKMIKDFKRNRNKISYVWLRRKGQYIDCMPINLFMINSERYLMNLQYLYRI